MKKTAQTKKIKKDKKFLNFYTGIAAGLLLGFLAAFFPQHLYIKTTKHLPTPTKQLVQMKTFVMPTPIVIATPPATLRMPIIMYHYVETVADPKDIVRQKLDIVPAELEKQLKNLQDNNYETVFVKDIPDFMNGKKAIPKNPISLTFDDGYEDFYIHAFPLLKKYQMKATVYIIYDFIGKKGFMTKNDIQKLLDSGLIEVGSHTLDHLYLSKTPLPEARKQIFESKENLEKMFNIKIETFAYPIGAFDKNVVEMTKEASYSAAVSVMPGIEQSKDNMFTLYRIRPETFVDGNVVKGLEKMR